MIAIRPLSALCAAGLLLGDPSPTRDASPPADVRRQLDGLINTLDANDRIMGSLTVRRAGRVIYSRTIGHRDSTPSGWVDSDSVTVFRVGSVTKSFTAAMTYRLIDAGKLSLDTRVSRFFPQLPSADSITARDLLAHTSGLPDFTAGMDPYVAIDQQTILRRIAGAPRQFSPGSRRRYSNSNFVLLGYIIESVTKSSYAQQLRELVTAPAGLVHTRVGSAIASGSNEARAYYFDDGHWVLQPEDVISNAGGAGSLVSTTEELTRFLSALFERRLISPTSLHEMTHGFESGGVRSGKGLSAFTIPEASRVGYAHDGSIGAHTALIGYVPQDSLAVALTVNGHNYPISRLFFHVWSILYQTGEPLPTFAPAALPDSLANRFVGTYASKEYGFTMNVRRTATGLEAQTTGQTPFAMTYIGRNQFDYPFAGILIDFGATTGDVAAGYTLFQQKLAIRLERTQPAP
jgi:D-alanyl-D-alanine carboxypeptidase